VFEMLEAAPERPSFDVREVPGGAEQVVRIMTWLQQLETYTADVMRQKLPLRTSQTPAMLIGSTLEMSNNFAALGILIFAIATALRRRRGSAT
jgi:hypothetical protein